jgi:hypothetical protein
MFNVRISAIAAGIAFVVSFLLGLLSGASLPFLIIRPLIFGVLFFVIAAVVYFLVSHFLPELLDESGPEPLEMDDALSPGSKINITEEEPAGAGAVAYAAPEDDSEDNLGDISDLLGGRRAAKPLEADSPGLDHYDKDGYTRSGAIPAGVSGGGNSTGSRGVTPKPVMASDSGDLVDLLPDLDSMAKAFLPNSGEEGMDTTEYSTSDGPLKRPAGGRGRKMDGDFNPKELAAGIRTILKKEG